VSFTPTQPGQHQVSVTFKGRHLQGSSFNFEVVDRPIYRRDYSKVGDQPASQFGSKGSGNGQFSGPYSVACNSRGERFLLLIRATIAFRCLIEMADFCSSLGQKDKEMVSLTSFGV